MNTNDQMTDKDSKLAASAQALYLFNISFLPILSFVILIHLYVKNRYSISPIAVLHFRQSILANIISGVLLLAVSGIILFIGGLNSPYTWMILLIYFICIHSALILFGVFAFIRALAKQEYVYPVFGKLWQ